MKFAFIGPAESLKWAKRLGYHMALAPEVILQPEYRKFYQDMHRQGHFIMLDNGAAEGTTLAPFDLMKVAALIGADEIILPDVLGNREQTIRYFKDSEDWQAVPPIKRFVVPQGQNAMEWVDCLRWFLVNVDFVTVGIPKLLGLEERIKCLQWLEDAGQCDLHHIHLLGLNKDPLEEVACYRAKFPWVRGVDSGCCVAFAQQGLTLHSNGHHGLVMDNGGYDSLLVSHNLDQMMEACNALPHQS